MRLLPMRQVHLDFHTAGQISDVGADWDPDAFVETLRKAHVNSINLFARGHHGYVYYSPTRFERHPGLQFDLLGEQVAACHRAGITTPLYITVGWDELSALRHPEWLEVTPEGVLGQHSPLTPVWKKLCLNSPYLDYVCEQTEEVIAHFEGQVDGLWFDIILQGECVCAHCRRDMRRQGLDPASSADRRAFARQVLDACRHRLYALAQSHAPGALVVFNSGHVGYEQTIHSLDCYTHFELESLPSSGVWGYNHYPISVRYVRTLGKPHLGMTAKFHTMWGDFSSYKNQAALEFECFQMLANGAACSIGDQLHPRGRLDPVAYDLIGRVYAQVEAKEPWCQGAEPLTEIAVFNVEAVHAEDGRVDTSHAGVLRMLLEGHHQFDYIDERAAWERYRVIIFPDKVPFDEALAARVQAYLDQGGKIIASHRSGLRPDGTAFALTAFGLEVEGEAPYSVDYLHPLPALGADLADVAYAMYERALAVQPQEGTRILAETFGPYFERTWEHFCSHRQTPMEPANRLAYPSITINADGNVIYFAHPIFYGYRRQAPVWYKKLFLAALGHFLPDPLVKTDAPTSAQVTVTRQTEQKRQIVHLLHYIPERRGLEFDTIEDVIPLYNVALALRAPNMPRRIYLAPTGVDMKGQYEEGYIRLIVPEVRGHQMVVFEGLE